MNIQLLSRLFFRTSPRKAPAPVPYFVAAIPRGLSLYEMNVETSEITKLSLPHIAGTRYRMDSKKENCIYECALNLETARKKFQRGIERAVNKLNQQITE